MYFCKGEASTLEAPIWLPGEQEVRQRESMKAGLHPHFLSLGVCPWGSYFIFCRLSLLTNRMGVTVMPLPWSCCRNTLKE